jgi:hypothetical protein
LFEFDTQINSLAASIFASSKFLIRYSGYLNKLAVIIPEFNPQERAVNSQPLNEKKLKSFLEKYASLIDSASSGKLKETSHIMYFIRQQWNATFKEPHLQIPQEELNL